MTSHIQDVKSEDVAKAVADGSFVATTVESRLGECDAISIAVPTPLSKTRDPDMAFVLSAADAVAATCASGPARRARKHHLSRHHARAAAAAPRGGRTHGGRGRVPGLQPRARRSGQSRLSHEEHAQGRGRHHARLRGQSASALYESVHRDGRAGVIARGGGAGQAAREHLPRGEHRPGERNRDRV